MMVATSHPGDLMSPRHFVVLFVLAVTLFPRIASAQLLIEDDFESVDGACWSAGPDTVCGAWTVYGTVGTLATGEVSHSGGNALRLVFEHDEDSGGVVFAFPEEDRLFTRYYEYYAADFDWPCGMKVHRLSSFNSGTDINNFDIIDAATGVNVDRDFCGVNDFDYSATGANGGPTDWGPFSHGEAIERERWYCVEHEIRLNDPGAANGEVRVWIDDLMVAEGTGVDIRGGLTAGLNRVLFGGWYSNGCGGANPCPDAALPAIRYVDDVAVGRSRIGCGSRPPLDGGPETGADGGSGSGADAGTDGGSGSDAGAGTDAGGAADGGGDTEDGGSATADAGAPAADGEGCGCRTGPGSKALEGALFLAFFLVLRRRGVRPPPRRA